jgi:hypothetical protein
VPKRGNSKTYSSLRAELGSTLDRLQQALAALTTHLRHEARAAWVWHPSHHKSASFATPPPDLPRAAMLSSVSSGNLAGGSSLRYAVDVKNAP